MFKNLKDTYFNNHKEIICKFDILKRKNLLLHAHRLYCTLNLIIHIYSSIETMFLTLIVNPQLGSYLDPFEFSPHITPSFCNEHIIT